MNERVGAVTLLLSGTPLANWQNVLSELPEGHTWNDEAFETALKSFALKYCSKTTRQEQKRFMKRNVGLPSDQLTAALLSRLQQFNRYLPYLPGVGNKFDPDDIREISVQRIFLRTCTLLSRRPSIISGSTKIKRTARSVPISIGYWLLVQWRAVRNLSPHTSRSRTKSTIIKNLNLIKIKKFNPENFKKGKTKCLFCGNLGHEEFQCRFKQKASAEAQKRAKVKPEAHENNVIDIDDFSDEFERLDELPEIQEFMDNMNMEVRDNALPQTSVK